jgi:hypothetical protein
VWRACIVALAACGRIGFAPSLDAAPDAPPQGHLVRVLQGTESLQIDLDVTLPVPIITEHAFLVFSARSSGTGPRSQVSGQITGSTQIHLHRPDNSQPMTVSWYVAEFDDTVEVQRGQVDNLTDIALAPIDPNESFVLISWSNGFNSLDNNDWDLPLLDATNLHVNPTAFLLYWQVVTMHGASVQRGVLDMPGTTATMPITPVPADRTLTLLNWTLDLPDSGTTIGPDQVIGALASDQLTTMRGAAGEVAHTAYQLVTFPVGTRVLSGQTTFDNTQTSLSTDLGTTWDPNRAIAVATAQPTYGASTFVGDLLNTCYVGGVMFTVDATSGNAVQLDRANVFPTGTDTATMAYQVVEFTSM